MSIYYYDNHPPAFALNRRSPRRAALSGVVVIHTAENAPDFTPPDTGAENVARFLTNRTSVGSYHRMVDSDSTVAMMPWTDEAAGDATGTNRHAVHLSFATQAHRWPTKPKWWRDAALQRMALVMTDFAMFVREQRGVDYTPPAKWITGDQARSRIPGIVGHMNLDPDRRSDPGHQFPRKELVDLYGFFLGHNIGLVPSDPVATFPLPRIQVPLQLSPGDRGPAVADLQSTVNFWHSTGLKVDGLFGDLTAHAVRQFKNTLREGYQNPEFVGDSPLWGFRTAEAYGWFLRIIATL